MLYNGGGLGLGLPLWNDRNLFQDSSNRVERAPLFHFLREGFILQHAVVVFSLHACKDLGPIEVVLHVRDSAAKSAPFINGSPLHWVSLDVTWLAHDLTGVLLASIVLLYVNEVCHVHICRLNWMFHMTLQFEPLLISSADLPGTFFSALNLSYRKCIGLSVGIVSWSTE